MIEVKGDDKLIAKMKDLRKGTINKFVRTRTRDNCKVMASRAKIKAPRKTGLLVRKITVRALKRSTVKVGSRVAIWFPPVKEGAKGGAFYGGFQEWGFTHKKSGRKIAGKRFMQSVATKQIADETAEQIATDIAQAWETK